MNQKTFAIAIIFLSFSLIVNAGPIAYGLCQTGCNVIWVSCYAAAGFVAGTVTAGAGTPLVILGCNAAQGVCMAGCVALLVAPTP
ncbi:3171_t:CDS:2 [Gigaspora rosea]|nr:3171_t:CDS:2 [Gigaspora rosea]